MWYYQGGASPDYIGTAVELSASGWSAQTVLSPVTVDGNLVLWARNTTTGVLSQYPVDYGTDGYPYLGSATQLTVPGSPSLTAANYPGIYSLELGSTSATPYPDLVTQDANGQDLYYPGAAPAGSLAAFTVAQPLGQPADALTASYQDGSGAVHTYTAAGVTSPASSRPPDRAPPPSHCRPAATPPRSAPPTPTATSRSTTRPPAGSPTPARACTQAPVRASP